MTLPSKALALQHYDNCVRHVAEATTSCILSPEARESLCLWFATPMHCTKRLAWLHKLGVLYLPQWSQIVGQMQFDLFHVYTVDGTVFDCSNTSIAYWSNWKPRQKHPICCEVYPRVQRKSCLIWPLSSTTSVKVVVVILRDWCGRSVLFLYWAFGLSKPEAKQVAWLVQNHLLMSGCSTSRYLRPRCDNRIRKKGAWRRITRAAGLLNRRRHLRNQPRAMEQLETNSTRRVIPLNSACTASRLKTRSTFETVFVTTNKWHPRTLLRKEGFTAREIECCGNVWSRLLLAPYPRLSYLSIVNIYYAWKIKSAFGFDQRKRHEAEQYSVCCKDQAALFATVVAELDRRNFNVHDARVMASKDGHVLTDTFIVLDQHGRRLTKQDIKLLQNIWPMFLADGRPAKIKTSHRVTYSTLR